MNYKIIGFDETTSTLTIQYDDMSIRAVILPISEDGKVPAGDDLHALIAALPPMNAPRAPAIANASQIAEMVVPATIPPEAAKLVTWGKVRMARNILLTESDFSVMIDSPISDEDRPAWIAYRAALRGLTASTDDPSAVVWPARPDGQEMSDLLKRILDNSDAEAPVKKKRSR